MKYYIDCEFDGLGGDLLSMGIVSEQRRSLYVVMDQIAFDPWVRANVVPIFFKVPEDRIDFVEFRANHEELTMLLQSYFLGDETPHVIADWPDDIHYLCNALITGPGTMINVPRMLFELRRVDAYPTDLEDCVQHNAYWDAVALRHVCESQDRRSPPSGADATGSAVWWAVRRVANGDVRRPWYELTDEDRAALVAGTPPTDELWK